jgi:hypothetical protein
MKCWGFQDPQLHVSSPYVRRFDAFAFPTEWGTVNVVSSPEGHMRRLPQMRELLASVDDWLDCACRIERGAD